MEVCFILQHTGCLLHGGMLHIAAYWVLATWKCASYSSILGVCYIEMCFIWKYTGCLLHRGVLHIGAYWCMLHGVMLHIAAYRVLATWRCASYSGILGACYMEMCFILQHTGCLLH